MAERTPIRGMALPGGGGVICCQPCCNREDHMPLRMVRRKGYSYSLGIFLHWAFFTGSSTNDVL